MGLEAVGERRGATAQVSDCAVALEVAGKGFCVAARRRNGCVLFFVLEARTTSHGRLLCFAISALVFVAELSSYENTVYVAVYGILWPYFDLLCETTMV